LNEVNDDVSSVVNDDDGEISLSLLILDKKKEDEEHLMKSFYHFR